MALEKLASVLPTLSHEEAARVDYGLWQALYKRLLHAPSTYGQLALDVASLLKNKQSIPYLQKMKNARDLPEDLHAKFDELITVLSSQ